MMCLLLILALDGTLNMKRQTTVDEGVYLSDVLTSESYRSLKARGVRNLWVTKEPSFSRNRVILRDQVEAVIHKAYPRKSLHWKGPTNMVVRRATGAFDREAVASAVQAWATAYETPLGTVHVEEVFVPNLSKVPKGEMTYRVRPRGSFKPAGRQSLLVDLSVDGKVFKSLGVQASLTLEAFVGTVIGELQRGTPINEDVVEWSYKRLDRLQAMPLTPEQAQNARTRSILRSGTMLTNRNVEPIPVVVRNQPVTVVARMDGLQITLRGLALETGSYGQQIRVKNTTTNKIMVGQIRKDGRVYIDVF